MFFQNIDCDSTMMPFLNNLSQREQVAEEDLYPFIDEFIPTRVTDIILNVNAQISMSLSEKVDDFAKIYERKTEDGYPVDYTDIMRGFYTIYKKFGLDPFAVWFRRIRQVGMRSHISFRMNDCHEPDAKTSWLRSSFFYTARDNGWMNGAAYGYFRNTFNYRFPEVRRFFLDYIEEQLLRYDVDGVEFDFMREIFCFDFNGKDKGKAIPVMNDFMRACKAIVQKAEKKHGHPLEITVRLTHDIAQSMAFGFDPITWEKEGLVDRIIPSPRFHGSNSHIPVAAWKKALPRTQIIPCLEGLISTDWGMCQNGFARMTGETVRGHAASYLYQGADGVYTFNMFGQDFADDPSVAKRDKEVQCTLGTYEEITAHTLRFTVINQDGGLLIPEGCTPCAPIPLLPEREEKGITLYTGNLPADKQGRLILGISEGTVEDLVVSVNGAKISALSPIATPAPISAMPKGTVCYAAPLPLDAASYEIAFRKIANRPLAVSWIEIEAK